MSSSSFGLTSAQTTALLLAAASSPPDERATIEDQVVTAHMPLAARIAGRYRQRGIDVEDLTQVAHLALVMAARRFDHERGEFPAFASVTISGEIKKYFRDHGWMMRPPRSVQLLQASIGRAEELHARAGDDRPGIDQMALELDVDRNAVADAMTARGCFSMASLDAPTFGNDRTLGDSVASVGDDLDLVDGWVDLRPAWDLLDAADKQLLVLRFFDDLTQENIARIVGSTQMQISRRLKAVLATLKESMAVADAA